MYLLADYYLIIVAALVAAALGTLLFLRVRRRSGSLPASAQPAETARPARLADGLARSRQGLVVRLREAWGAGKDTEARLSELEEVLLGADIGPKATQQLLGRVRPVARQLTDADALRQVLRDHMRALLEDGSPSP